jgi:hypothetical protein
VEEPWGRKEKTKQNKDKTLPEIIGSTPLESESDLIHRTFIYFLTHQCLFPLKVNMVPIIRLV